jgi:hypothetical protein
MWHVFGPAFGAIIWSNNFKMSWELISNQHMKILKTVKYFTLSFQQIHSHDSREIVNKGYEVFKTI